LPDSARNLVTRSLRLNQANVATASAYLSSLGASTLRSFETVRIEQIGQPPNQRFVEIRDTEIRPLEAKEGSAPLLLRGVTVAADERLNTITLVGSPRKVELASTLLTQLDARRRQVAVNVKVIDINLLALDRISSSFSFGINDTGVVNEGGIGVINFGTRAPASTFGSFTRDPVTGPITNPAAGLFATPTNSNIGNTVGALVFKPFNFANQFLLQLQAAVTNGNAKILTDPTLVVQEGQEATVNLTQEVVTNIKQDITSGTGSTTTTVTVEKANAGLTLPVKVDRIDDNGFVSLSVAPTISSPDQQVQINAGGSSNTITLLQSRSVQSGQIRLRDGQSLVLSGIIQDSDRTSVTKIPILGDLPILGALFRKTDRQNLRREVIVLVTPRVIDDNQTATFGYTFNPSRDAREMLDRSPQPPQP